MSLSQEPLHSVLKNEVVCGYRDISHEPYAGFSGAHRPDGKAIKTTNGAGPHNLQTFILASDGTVLHCLPGYWNPTDMVHELEFAGRLHDVWVHPSASVGEKKAVFRDMHLAHISEHSPRMVRRSRMQGFDKKFEAKHRLHTSDTILDTARAQYTLVKGSRVPPGAFKTTDRIMHERMAARPFVQFASFDVARFADYGRPKYDKNEDFRDMNGKIVDRQGARKQEMLGQVPEKKRRKRQRMRRMKRMAGTSARYVVNYGIRSALP